MTAGGGAPPGHRRSAAAALLAASLAACVPADAADHAVSALRAGTPAAGAEAAATRVEIHTPGLPNAPALLATPEGLHLAFHAERDGRPADVHVAVLGQDGWGVPENVSRSEAPSSLPRLARGSGGVLHAVWGERASDPTTRPGAPPTAIHHAFRTPEGWSAPVEVFRTPHEGVRPPESLVVDGAGHLHLAFAARDLTTRRVTVYHARFADGGWSEPAPVAHGVDPDLALGPDGALHLVFLEGEAADDRSSRRDVNSIFTVRSADGGRSWSAPVRVRRSGMAPAHRPRLAEAGGELHLLWLQAADPTDLYPDVVLHARSADGVEWTPAVLVSRGVAGVPTSTEAAAGPGGTLHATFHVSAGVGAGPHRPYHAVWRNGAWSAPEHLGGVERGSQRIAVAVDGGAAHLVLGAGDLPAGPGLYHFTVGVGGP